MKSRSDRQPHNLLAMGAGQKAAILEADKMAQYIVDIDSEMFARLAQLTKKLEKPATPVA